MCGIFGYIYFNSAKKVEKEILVKMGESIKHRGPDDNGLYLQDNVGFGHNRLAIIDLKTGHQPLSNEDGTVWVSFNGELYNFERLICELKKRGHVFKTKTDSEILVHLYEDKSIGFINEIEGMFSFVLWDKKRKKLFLVRDRFGIKPLYYTHNNDVLIFASELKSIVSHPEVSKELDITALSHYFTYGYVPAPMSIFKNIKKISPANYLSFSQNDINEETYWSSFPRENKKCPEKESTDNLFSLLKDSVQKHLRSDMPLGVFSSGGVDSSIIAYLAALQTERKLKLFNISFDDAEYDESRYAKLLADNLEAEYISRVVSSNDIIKNARWILELLDEPFADASFIPTYFLSFLAKEHVKVCLSGDGADEIFGGYPTYMAQPLADIYRQIPCFVRKNIFERLIKTIPVRNSNNKMDFLFRAFVMGADYSDIERCIIWFGPMAPKEVNNLFRNEMKEKKGKEDVFEIVREYIMSSNIQKQLEKCLSIDRRFYLSDNILVKVDMASMANSLDAVNGGMALAHLPLVLAEGEGRGPARVLGPAQPRHLSLLSVA